MATDQSNRECPPYISWRGHGEIALPAPASLADTYWNIFAFRIDANAAQALADKLLNAASGGAVHYRVAGPLGGVTFQTTGKLTAPAQPFGWIAYDEMSVWVPLIETRADGATRLVCWLPYVFPSAIIPLVSGREGWGFQKSLASFDIPDDVLNTGPAQFRCITTLFKTLSDDCEGVDAPLITVQRGDGPHGIADMLRRLETTAESIGEELADIMRGDDLDEDLRLALSTVTSLFSATFHVVDLFQVRDPVDQGRAIFQALTDCPMTIDRFHGLKLLPGDWRVRVADVESHQVIRDLGLPTGPDGDGDVPVLLAMRYHVDFSCTTQPFIWTSAG